MNDDIQAVIEADPQAASQPARRGLLARMGRFLSEFAFYAFSPAGGDGSAQPSRIPFSLISAPQFVIDEKK